MYTVISRLFDPIFHVTKKRALISVSDKSGIVKFAQFLADSDYEIISTGGTKKELEQANIPVLGVEDITQFNECFSGRVKTMHPLLMGGILFRRNDSQHEDEAQNLGINPIDIVVVNLYPFEETANDTSKSQEELIEQIDIGGPTLLRSAAKNYKDVTVITDPEDYDRVISELQNSGSTSDELRKELALKTFVRTSAYDGFISKTLSNESSSGLTLTEGMDLRYGENPHQWGKFYQVYGSTEPRWKFHQGKEMSYLNILDADGAWNLVCEFSEPTAACIKHANPSGVASDENIETAFQKSYDADRLSAFGVIIALNKKCTQGIVEKIFEQKIFTEVLIAPSYEDEALELLKSKPKLRVIEFKCAQDKDRPMYRSMLGGVLVQNIDSKIITEKDLTCVTKIKPSDSQIRDLLFAWHVVKHAKSNAIVFAKDLATVGIGCGQTSRVDSTVIAARRAGERAKDAAMASDAFFPFADSIEEAARNGIGAIIQPGGSIRDKEVIAKADELNIPMVTTGIRGFRH